MPAAAYCMMEEVDCSVSGWGWVLLGAIGVVAVAVLVWTERQR